MDETESPRDNRLRRKEIMNQKRKACDRYTDAASSSSSPLLAKRYLQISESSCPKHQPLSHQPTVDSAAFILDLGSPEHVCQFCGAIFWYEERLKSNRSQIPVYTACCSQGRITLPSYRNIPSPLKELIDYGGGTASKNFRKNIRVYNSMFAFTSTGGKIDKGVNKGQGPYIFKINGQNHHMIGTLMPLHGEKPHFAQLYIYDTNNEVKNRLSTLQTNGEPLGVDESVVSALIEMFDKVNELVKVFRMARDRFTSGETHPVSLRLCGKRPNDGLQYNAPAADEMAGLIVGDIGQTSDPRDIIVEYQNKKLKRIDDLHPSFMSMQYPILFPYGEDGYRLNIHYQINPNKPALKRGNVTRREYYSYVLQQRNDENQLLIRGGKLFQQYIVDAFTCIEDERLRYIRFKHQQDHYRCEIYKGVQDAFLRGDTTSSSIGQRVILPSSFTGGPRYMIQNYHDAMAICRSRGNPDLFITFTCNVKWNEIQNALALIPSQKVEDRPDIVSRVFNMKLTQLIKDIKTGKYFGNVTGAVYTVEFQKRGLPHVHIIVWLHEEDKYPTPTDIDKIICAEIPNKDSDPELYDVVSKFMMHGPCGLANAKAPCMNDGRCMKHFPKKKFPETTIGEDGFAIYRRRADNSAVLKSGVELDNRFVVPYNKGLLLKYQAHLNVEWCNRSRSIKYLFKYVNKGPDRTRAVLQENGQDTEKQQVDEIKNYVDCRYLAAYESCWRIFEYHIHYKFPSVERLAIHMPLMNNITFRGEKEISAVLSQPGVEKTMLTEWMLTNSLNVDACDLTYADFPSSWRWDGTNKIWFRRKRSHCIGRISYVHPSAGDSYYLRILLSHLKGPKSFSDMRTVNGVLYDTFKETCNAMGLIGDDREWHEAMHEATQWATSGELRNLFITLILFCEVSDANKLFSEHLTSMQDDIIYKAEQQLQMGKINLTDKQKKNQVLLELQKILERTGSSLEDFKLPLPTTGPHHDTSNTLLREELCYNTVDSMHENEIYMSQMNTQQKEIYEAVLKSVYQKSGGLFFLYGHGGTGKTFVYSALIKRLRSEGQIVLAVASSGIASLLLPGGRTVHSRFKIPIDINEESTCYIKKATQLADLIKISCLIVWDEAPMAHRHCFEALNRTLNDLLEDENCKENTTTTTFGGKTVLLGGDFRQILPVVIRGSRHDTVHSSITKSELWSQCQIYRLTQNMRLSMDGLQEFELSEMTRFAQWLLDIGEGKLEVMRMNEEEESPTWIRIPDSMLINSVNTGIEDLTSEIYDKLDIDFKNPTYLKERAIITGTNEAVDKINTGVLSRIPSEEKKYLSFDSICKVLGGTDEDDILYPPEFLNSLSFSGVPNHILPLKVDTPVMLLRNINQNQGLCNGTRLLITKMGDMVIEATIITRSHEGDRVYIPKIVMTATDRKWPFAIKRRQLPLRLCYAMTINKSQGQTLAKVGLYLPRPVFTHGQLYVAASRVTNYKGLKILLSNDEGATMVHTKNIVYQEIFEDL